jgi:P2 family phage contractile tail tube protein
MSTKEQKVIWGGNVWLKDQNLALSCAKFKLPDLSRAMEDINASGSYFGLQVPREIEAMTATVTLNGPDSRVRIKFGREPGDWSELYYYERIKEIVAGVEIGRVVYLKGLFTKVEQPEVTQNKASGQTVATMTTIVHYHDRENGKTIHKFDYFNNTVVVDGVDLTATHNQLIAWS